MGALADIEKLEPGALIELYELDSTFIGGQILRFHSDTHAGSIWWQGNEYSPWAIQIEGLGRTGEGQQPMPTLSVSNIGPDGEGNVRAGVISALCIALNDLVGSRFIIHQTFAQYLDAVNFPGGNPTADPNEHLPLENWIVEQKTGENAQVVTFSLSSPLDFNGVTLPRRKITATVCGFLWHGGYRGPNCQYNGTRYFDRNGNPVNDPTQDVCGGLVSDCQKRWGEWQPITFGSFPGADLVR